MSIFIIIILVGVIAYLYFRRSGEPVPAGRIDPQAIALRKSLLTTTDDFVHEQWVMLFCAAMLSAEATKNQEDVARMSDLELGRICVAKAKDILVAHGFNPSDSRLRLTFEVYQEFGVVWRRRCATYRSNYLSAAFAESSGDYFGFIAFQICKDGAAYLDEQFRREGKADLFCFFRERG